MEITWRTVMILIGLLAVILIVIDGLRRMQRSRAAALKIDISKDFRFPDAGHSSEVGQARVVGAGKAAERGASAERVAATHRASGKQTPAVKHRPAGAFVADGGNAVEPDIAFSAQDDLMGVMPASVAPRNTGDTTAGRLPAQQGSASAPGVGEERGDSGITESDIHTEAAEVSDDFMEAVEPVQDLQSSIHTWLDANSSEVSEPLVEMEQAAIIPRIKPANLDESVPVLMAVEVLGAEPVLDVDEVSPKAASTSSAVNRTAADKTARKTGSDNTGTARSDSPVSEEQGFFSAETAYDKPLAEFNDPHLEDEIEQQDDVENAGSELVIYAREDAEMLSARQASEVVLMIHARAREEQGMSGLDLLHLFDGCDLRFGAEGIFHRFEEADGKGPIQFSIAQTWEPGVFDPVTMEEDSYAGLTLFMSLPGATRPQESYMAMTEMARLMAKHLNAELLDSTRSIFTLQTTEHDRQQIAEFERRQHLANKQRAGKKR
jgi:cell division protein ZipA